MLFSYLSTDYNCNTNRGYSIKQNMLDFYYGGFAGYSYFNESNSIMPQNHPIKRQTDVSFELNRTDNFAGVISFNWLDAFERTGTSRYELLVCADVYPSKPIRTIEGEIEGEFSFNEVTRYKFIVTSGESHSLISAHPKPSDLWFHEGFGPIYSFDTDLSESAVHLVFQQNSVDKWGRILLMILSTLLGIGVSTFMQATFGISGEGGKRD